MHRLVTASAPGRVCFAGEDIDWISGPAVLGAIDLRIRVTVEPLPLDAGLIVIKSSAPFNVERRLLPTNIGQYNGHPLDYVEAAIKVISEAGIIITPIKIAITSVLPAQAGLSSSGAISVASIAALAKFYGLELTDFEICRLAYSVESDELNTGAGQMDFYICGLGGFMYIDCVSRPPQLIEKYSFPPETAIIIADTRVRRSTADVIRIKRARLEIGESGIISYVHHTEAAISRIHSLLHEFNLDIQQIGAIVSSCHRYLDSYMGVSTNLLNICVETCLKNGALGAKLTGTGMGGCMFALVPVSRIDQIQTALSSYPVLTYVTSISNRGIVMERID